MAEARRESERFRELAPNMTIEEFAGGSEADRPDQHRIFKAARLLDLPFTKEDLKLANVPTTAVVRPLEPTQGD